MKKTNAMRILEGLKIPYEAKEYDDDGLHELARGAAQRMAEKLGTDPAQVFKTIVMRSETKEVCVFCQSAICEINLKKARAAVGCKEILPVKPEELQGLTGYVRGGCTPLGMKKKFRTFIDASALSHDHIYISAGLRGMQLKIAPQDRILATEATVVDLELWG